MCRVVMEQHTGASGCGSALSQEMAYLYPTSQCARICMLVMGTNKLYLHSANVL